MSLTQPTTPVEVPPTPDVPIVTRVVAWIGLVQVVLGALAASTAFTGLHESIPGTLATLTLVLGAVQAYLNKAVQSQVTASADVVEVRQGGDVVAGPANDMVPAGETVRPADTPQQYPTRDARHDAETPRG